MKALEMLKVNSNKDALILIIEDGIAKKVLFAWTNLFPVFKDFDAEGLTLSEVLSRAWEATPDFDTLSRISGIPRRTVEEKVVQLSRARLIYPDGSASELALKMIEAEISAKVRKLVGTKKPEVKQ